MNGDSLQAMVTTIKMHHGSQTRAGGVEFYWTHCDRVARLLEFLLEVAAEGEGRRGQAVVLAALGHDLYEDTGVSRAEISGRFGSDVDALIEEVTNRAGDANVELYAAKLPAMSEGARLIKLADLYDNYTGGACALFANSGKWTERFLWPTLEQQWHAIRGSEFVSFPDTALRLRELV